MTSGGVVGLSFYFSSSISYLYPSTVYMMIYIYSFVLLSIACTLSIIILKTSCSFFARLSAFFFSSYFSVLNFSIFNCIISLTSLATSSSIASSLARDCTSCVMLTCNLNSAFVGIFAKTNSNCSKYFSSFCTIFSSIFSMSYVMLKFGLVCAMNFIVSSSSCAIMSSSSVDCYIGPFPLSYFCMSCIHSRTCLTSIKSFIILSLWFSASSYSLATWS
jgi:hypothetical protein